MYDITVQVYIHIHLLFMIVFIYAPLLRASQTCVFRTYVRVAALSLVKILLRIPATFRNVPFSQR